MFRLVTLKHAHAFAFAIVLATAPLASASPFHDAERRVEAAYADYRAALFQTNQRDSAATERAIAAFRVKWGALAADWRASPPPQYADDPMLGETLATVTRLTEEAAGQAARGDLAGSHNTLEGIRDTLGALRARNGILVFSDRMNAYHELMEHVIGHAYDAPAALGEDVAVLAHLARQIGANRPASADAAAFGAAFDALQTSVDALRAAMRSGDSANIEQARKGLKGPYSRLFLRFG
jgi:hypothetical protein